MIDASVAEWCGACHGGRVRTRSMPWPASEAMLVTSSAASPVRSGQQAGQPGRQHRLARSGRPEHQEVVPARGGDDERLDPLRVPDDLAQVEAGDVLALHRRTGYRVDVDGLELGAVPDRERPEARHGDHLDAVDEARLRLARAGDDDSGPARTHRRADGGQHAGHRTQTAVEAQLAEEHRVADRLPHDRAGGAEHRDGDPEVEAGAVLRHRGRGEVHREVSGRASRTPSARRRCARGPAPPATRCPAARPA